MHKKLLIFCLIFGFCLPCVAKQSNSSYPEMWAKAPLYFGLSLGYGSTDWSMVKNDCGDDPDCTLFLDLSTPEEAGDTGAVWGAFAGYEIQPHFALQADFHHFPSTTLQFAPGNYYNAYFGTPNSFVSETYTIDLIGKFMVQIVDTGARAYADIGPAVTRRVDDLSTFNRVTGTFGCGINYVFNTNYMIDLGFQYYAGFDDATLVPAQQYTPFLYVFELKLGYRISV